MGKTIAIIGILVFACRLAVMLLERFGLRGAPLPGDIYVKRGNWSFCFPDRDIYCRERCPQFSACSAT